jgi:hypothetical protein
LLRRRGPAGGPVQKRNHRPAMSAVDGKHLVVPIREVPTSNRCRPGVLWRAARRRRSSPQLTAPSGMDIPGVRRRNSSTKRGDKTFPIRDTGSAEREGRAGLSRHGGFGV